VEQSVGVRVPPFASRCNSRSTPAFTPAPTWVPEDVNTVIRAISDLRKAAVAAT